MAKCTYNAAIDPNPHPYHKFPDGYHPVSFHQPLGELFHPTGLSFAHSAVPISARWSSRDHRKGRYARLKHDAAEFRKPRYRLIGFDTWDISW